MISSIARLALFALAVYCASAPEARASIASRLPECDPKLEETQFADQPAYLEARAKCRKKWAVLVYMAADNDLTPYAYWDLYEMESVGSGPRTDVLVQLDDDRKTGLKRCHIRKSPEWFDHRLGKEDFDREREKLLHSPCIELPETSGDPARAFSEFLEWGMIRYPAEHHMVVIWGHGQGWSSKPAGGWAGIAIPAIREKLAEAAKLYRDEEPIDVYVSDACLMQMAEVVAEFAGAARFVVGSAEIQSYLGLPYRDVLAEIERGFSRARRIFGCEASERDEAQLLAKALPLLMARSFDASAGSQRADADAYASVTSSSFETETVKNSLLPSLRRFSLAMKRFLEEDGSRARQKRLIDEINRIQPFQGEARDLAVFLGYVESMILRSEADTETGAASSGSAQAVLQSIREVGESLDAAVVNSRYGSDYLKPDRKFPWFHSKAISLWVPPGRREYLERIEDFRSSAFYSATSWDSWLSLLY